MAKSLEGHPLLLFWRSSCRASRSHTLMRAAVENYHLCSVQAMIASKHVPGTAVTASLHKNTAKTAAGSDAFSGKHL